MRGNNIPINGTPRLEELANILKHLIATLSRHQSDGLVTYAGNINLLRKWHIYETVPVVNY